MVRYSAQAYIRVVLLQQLSEGLKQGDKEISRLAQYPAWLSNKDAQEHATHLQLTLPCGIRYCEVLRKLHIQIRDKSANNLHSLCQTETKTIPHFTFQLTSGLSFCCLKCLQEKKKAERKSKKKAKKYNKKIEMNQMFRL